MILIVLVLIAWSSMLTKQISYASFAKFNFALQPM